jgi:hypothetical protein
MMVVLILEQNWVVQRQLRTPVAPTAWTIGCSFCRLIRCPEHPIDRHWYLPANWRSFILWLPDQWVSKCYAIECDRSFCCVLCLSEHTLFAHGFHLFCVTETWSASTRVREYKDLIWKSSRRYMDLRRMGREDWHSGNAQDTGLVRIDYSDGSFSWFSQSLQIPR